MGGLCVGTEGKADEVGMVHDEQTEQEARRRGDRGIGDY